MQHDKKLFTAVNSTASRANKGLHSNFTNNSYMGRQTQSAVRIYANNMSNLNIMQKKIPMAATGQQFQNYAELNNQYGGMRAGQKLIAAKLAMQKN